MRVKSALGLACSWVIACSVPAPGTDDDGSEGSGGKSGGSSTAGAGGATAGSGGAKSGAGGGGAGGTASGGAGSAQAGAAGEPFGGGGAGSTQAGGPQAGQGGAVQVCSPGQQIACACPGGAQGAQACNSSGTGYGACDCPMGTGGGGGSSSGGAAGATTAGAAGSSGSGGSTPVDPVGDAEKCPGADLAFAGTSIVVTGTTKPAAGDYDPIKCTSAKSSEVVYKFIAPKSGTVTATVVPTGFDAVVYWSETTCSGDLPKACSASKGGYGEPESIDLVVVAGKPYWVFVDGWTQGFSGPFELTLTY